MRRERSDDCPAGNPSIVGRGDSCDELELGAYSRRGSLDSLPGRRPKDALEDLRHAVGLLLAVEFRLILDPGDLHYLALAGKGRVSVPGLVGAQEGEDVAHSRRDFDGVWLVLFAVVEHAQPAG